MLAACTRKQDNYISEPAGLWSKSGIDTISVNEPANIILIAGMGNCCGAQFVLAEINSGAISRTIKVDAQYEKGYPHSTQPEEREIPYTFTPSQKGNFYLYYAQRNGTYNVDTFFVR